MARRLETTSIETPTELRLGIMETFCEKMARSGYSRRQQVEIITAGIVGHKRKMAMRPKRHMRGCETEKSRRIKKLTGKTTWEGRDRMLHKHAHGRDKKGQTDKSRDRETHATKSHQQYYL